MALAIYVVVALVHTIEILHQKDGVGWTMFEASGCDVSDMPVQMELAFYEKLVEYMFPLRSFLDLRTLSLNLWRSFNNDILESSLYVCKET